MKAMKESEETPAMEAKSHSKAFMKKTMKSMGKKSAKKVSK